MLTEIEIYTLSVGNYRDHLFQRNLKNIRLSTLILSIFFFLVSLISKGQDIPKIIQPSPQAASLFRFQDYPVDNSTGVPQINVPLYEIKSGSLSVPIGLSYHASGRRVDDQDGPIALGWNLNAGGTISRTINGSVDFGEFKFPYPFKMDGITNQADYIYLEQITHYTLNEKEVYRSHWKDSEYDVFSYYFGSNNGKFIFKDINNIKTAVTIPYKPYVITPVFDSFSGLKGINILDDKGVFYEFVPKGTNYTSSPSNVYVNEYALSKIISADKADTVSFTYKSFNQTKAASSQKIRVRDKISSPDVANGITELSYDRDVDYSFYTVASLSEINFRNGKVVFVYAAEDSKVDKIQIFNNDNKLLRSIQLKRSRDSYALEGTASYITNKLDEIVFQASDGAAIENYSFEYYSAPQTLIPSYRDWWGFYNASGTTNLIPRYNNLELVNMAGVSFNFSVGYSDADRNPDLDGTRSGVLKKITYPTGGSSEFIYELNKYKHYSDPVVRDGPGLRIYQIKSNDRNGTTSYRTYTYGDNENGYGNIDLIPDIQYTSEQSNYYYFSPHPDPAPVGGNSYTYRERVFYDDFVPMLKELAGRPVTYTTVTEYAGTPDDNIGKTVYTYDYRGWSPYTLRGGRGDLLINRWHIQDYNYWNTPSLISQKEYKNIGNNLPYQLVKETTNQYVSNEREKVYALHIGRINVFPQNGVFSHPANVKGLYVEPFVMGYSMSLSNPDWMQSAYAYSPYQISSGDKKLSSSTQKVYHMDGSNTSVSTEYTYNSHRYISSVTENSSDGGSVTKKTTYPFDYQGNAVLTQMSHPGINMLDFSIEEIQSKNNVPTTSTKTNYFNWGTTVPKIYPQTIETRKGTLPYEAKIRFHSYDDYGNILSVSRENGPLESYIWSYRKSYPVAKVINADYSTLETQLGGASAVNAFSLSNPVSANTVYGFVDRLRNGNPSMMINTYAYEPLVGMTHETDASGKKRSYDYDNYQRLLHVKDHNEHIIKSLNYNYNNGEGTTSGLYFNRYMSRNFNKSGCSSGYGSGVTYRVPANKYSSSISQADADAKANAEISANGQAYANQNGICYYKNIIKEKAFSRNNCEGGVIGSSVIYTVPAGKYISIVSQADADAQADAEINANGQSNANLKGTCGFYNIEQFKSFKKNNCPANSIPSDVIYRVPIGKYYSSISQADADAKALADINANGQAYANTNGTCREGVNFTFSNSTSDSYAVSFTSVGGSDYIYYNCPSGYSSTTVPAGTYRVEVTILNSSNSWRVYIGARPEQSGARVIIFENVNVSNSGEREMRMMN